MRALLVAAVLVPGIAAAETYQVGPTRTYHEPSEVADLLNPGDVVEIDGDHTYTGGLIFDRAGSASSKITVRGVRVNGARPVISGGGNTIEARANHYVFEALDITGGTNRCFYHHADDITLRDAVVHDCPQQGILGADEDSGSLLLEYTEVHHCGEGTQNHQIYMSTDASMYPDAVFRMQFCYVHDANGGNNVKSRAARNEIYYNWVEGALYHELELIGSEVNPEDLVREDSDVVGNVLVKRNADSFVVRFGGDGTGQTNGRYRFVNNTVIVEPSGGAVFRLFDGIDSLEASNNVFAARGGGSVDVVREVEAVWVSGSSTIAGQNNWIPTGAAHVPDGFTGTITGDDPGFTGAATEDVRVVAGSPLVDAGTASSTGPAGHELPNPLPAPLFLPPMKTALAVDTAWSRLVNGAIDIGAFEYSDDPPPPGDDLWVRDLWVPGPGDDGGGCCSTSRGWGSSPLVLFVMVALRRRRQKCATRTSR